MRESLPLLFILLLSALSHADELRWQVSDPVMTPGTSGSFDAVAVKDPSLVFHGGAWHVFYTARGEKGYSLGYVQAEALEGLGTAERHALPQLGGKDGYAAAPQVFFFSPRGLWYLVYQTRDANYQPVYSTTETPGDPASWSSPKPLVSKGEGAKWIDFWVICDEQSAWLFYTRNHRDVCVMQTALEAFPSGWGKATVAYSGVHEAVHVYKASAHDRYHMIYEMREQSGRRSFGLAEAKMLGGPWRKVTDRWAAGEHLVYADGRERWTEEVSHGEVVRSGFDQRLAYDAKRPRMLIQGLLLGEHRGAYAQMPWRLGVITREERLDE